MRRIGLGAAGIAAFAVAIAAIGFLAPAMWLAPDMTMLAGISRQMPRDGQMVPRAVPFYNAAHRFTEPDIPVPWQGFTSKGPTIIGDNVWCGANVVVTSGVTIGQRCVIGANSVVTTSIPPFSIAAGAPAKVLRMIEY